MLVRTTEQFSLRRNDRASSLGNAELMVLRQVSILLAVVLFLGRCTSLQAGAITYQDLCRPRQTALFLPQPASHFEMVKSAAIRPPPEHNQKVCKFVATDSRWHTNISGKRQQRMVTIFEKLSSAFPPLNGSKLFVLFHSRSKSLSPKMCVSPTMTVWPDECWLTPKKLARSRSQSCSTG